MRNFRERAGDIRDPSRRERQRIAAGQHDLPNLGMRGDVVERGAEGRFVEPRLAGPDRLAAEAEAAIDRADRNKLQQHAVAVAMHDAADGALQVVADGIVEFALAPVELPQIGKELARDGIGGIVRINQCRQRGRQGERVALGDALKLPRVRRRNKTRLCEGVGLGQGSLSYRGRHGEETFRTRGRFRRGGATTKTRGLKALILLKGLDSPYHPRRARLKTWRRHGD